VAAKPKSAKKRALKALSPAATKKMWAEMRTEFETTEIGIRELARKYGIKSHTTVLRRVETENWKKQPGEIAANIATEAVIDRVLAADSSAEKTTQKPPENAKDQEKKRDSANPATGVFAGPLAVADQSGAVRAGRRMALVQQRQLLKEIEVADQVIGLSTDILSLLTAVLKEEDLAKANLIVSRFSAIGGKTESFSGLMRAATASLDKGISIRRRALNMEAKLGIGNQMPGAAADAPEQVKKMLPSLSTDQLLELRRAAAIMHKQIQSAGPIETAQTIDGVADAILGPDA
jgi:hypothetical protein